MHQLLTALGATQIPRCAALSEPAGIEGDLPDVALFETAARVLVLPVEVKPATMDLDDLLADPQPKRYARSFGGGLVLVTNLRSFALAQLDGADLAELARWTAVADPVDLDDPHAVSLDDPAVLGEMVEAGCRVHSTLADPAKVAFLLAWHGRQMKDAIAAAGDPVLLLAPILEAFEDGLDIELHEDLLVPTVVQTLLYGLFAAWLEDESSGDFDWRSSAYRIDVPLFAEVLHACLRPALIRQCDLFPRLDAAARVLDWVDRDKFVASFEGRAIEYFYEPFLASFDKDLRHALGVWYTPRQIATYQVARADHHLRTDLGIEAGLADPSVVVLDPASGTGTYLAATLDFIYQRHLDDGEPEHVAASRTREAASRIIGFEILPAAYIISHLHLGRHLAQLGAPLDPADRLRIYLTNTLTGWSDDSEDAVLTLFPELTGEVTAARKVKKVDPVIVVIGNPPYQGYSSAETKEERELMEPWIAPLWPEWGLRKHRLNDLYVRFWRISVRRIVELTGRGVISFISNRQWLGGRSYPTMRETVVTEFQRVVVDDLFGGVHDTDQPDDQSVFTSATATGIRVGTGIVTAVRSRPPEDGELAEVKGRDLRGAAAAKREQLAEWAQSDIDDGLVERPVERSTGYRFTHHAAGDHPGLDEYFDRFFSGVQPVRDEAVLSTELLVLEERMRNYFDGDVDWDTLIAQWPGFAVERARYDGQKVRGRLLGGSAFHAERIVRFLHRPLDARWLYWEPDHKLLNEARRDLMPYWLAVPSQVALVVPQTRRRPGAARPLVATQVPGFASMDPDARVLPLWTPAESVGGLPGQLGYAGATPAVTPNINQVWIDAVRASGCATGTDHEVAEQVFFALAGVCSSRAWVELQETDSSELPRVPLPSDSSAFEAAVDLGRRYALLVDPDKPFPGVTTPPIDPAYRDLAVPDTVSGPVTLTFGTFGQAGGRRVGEDVLWGGDSGWRNIPGEIWGYPLGGFPPIAKWLSYRVGHQLSVADREVVMLLARRVAAIRDLAEQGAAVFAAATAAPIETAL